MITERENVKISKFLSLILRHQPEKIGIELDENGWTAIKELIEKSAIAGVRFDFEILKFVVNTNNKKRFSFDDSLTKIRASQGHSVDVNPGYSPIPPPVILYHGTAIKNIVSIFESGLKKQNRYHVHLSTDTKTAKIVGQRHGDAIILEVLTNQMYADGYQFFLSDNNVWLTDYVPAKYLKVYQPE